MKLIVVTPTLGTSPWLEETVASVAAHATGAVHVLVAPACETAKLAARFPHALVVPEKEGRTGMYVAINAGMAAAGAWDAFTYINDDDLLLPGFGTNMQVAAAAAGRPLIVCGRIKLIDAKGRRLGVISISPAPELNRALFAQRMDPVHQQGMIATRAVIDAIGPFDPSFRLCGDAEFLMRACVRGIPFVCRHRQMVAAFRLHGGQLSKHNSAMNAERERVAALHNIRATIPARELLIARRKFRIANLAGYVERVLRHGFVTTEKIIGRTT
jgi:hypothetical protein